MACTRQTMRERPGSISVLRTHARLAASSSIRRIRTSYLSRRLVMPMQRIRIAASIVRATVVRPGRKFCSRMKMLAPSISTSIQATRRLFMQRCGTCVVRRGSSTLRRMGPVVASSNQLMAALHGTKSIRGFPSKAADGLVSRSPRLITIGFMLPSMRRRAASFARKMRAQPGPGFPAIRDCGIAAGTSRKSPPIRRTLIPFTCRTRPSIDRLMAARSGPRSKARLAAMIIISSGFILTIQTA